MRGDGGSTSSPWSDPNLARDPLAIDTDCDVCVVGAGIAGLSVAYHLLRDGRRVVLLDDGPVAGGETGRTTGHLNSYLDDGLSAIQKSFGDDGLRTAVASHAWAIDFVERVCREEGIDARFVRTPEYLFVDPKHPGQGENFLDAEVKASAAAHLPMAEATAPVPGLAAGARCVRFENQARFDVGRYLAGLATVIERLGGRLFLHTFAQKIDRADDALTVVTKDGRKVRCNHLVLCTNSPTLGVFADLLAIHSRQAAYRTYVVTLKVPAGRPIDDALYTDTNDPYWYGRLVDDDAGGHLFLAGGEDHKTGQANDGADRLARLETRTRELFPQLGERVHAWSGQVIEPADGLAFIGPNPGDDARVLIVTGDSGMGLTHGTLAGKLIADLVAGRPNEWADVYAPSRVASNASFGALKELVKEGVNVAAEYVEDFATRGDVASVDDLKPGCGAVVGFGPKKLACYRDDAGVVHERSALCPHFNAVVQWNALEKTWDCPAHGSRFNGDPARMAYGAQVTGCANAPLGETEQG